jgi:hypothetical protein
MAREIVDPAAGLAPDHLAIRRDASNGGKAEHRAPRWGAMVYGTPVGKGTSMPRCGWRTGKGLLAAFMPMLCLCATPRAWAQLPDHPLLLPKNDVAVVYQLDKVPLNGPHKMTVTYTEAGERVRVDFFRWIEAKHPYQSTIFDRRADRLITVQPERRAYLAVGIGSADNPGEFIKANMSARYLKPQGTTTVAHASCTEWVIDAHGKDNDGDTACFTDDGVLLRLASKRPSIPSLTAIDIHYGAPPDGTFDPPTGFRNEKPP